MFLFLSIQVDTNGTAFTLTTSDGKDLRVTMQEPVSLSKK